MASKYSTHLGSNSTVSKKYGKTEEENEQEESMFTSAKRGTVSQEYCDEMERIHTS